MFIQCKPLVLNSHKRPSKILLLLNQWLEALVPSALLIAALRSLPKVTMYKFKLAILSLVVLALTSSSVGCNTQPSHPNQINTFDGTSYDSLTIAHAALASFRVQVSTTDKQYIPVFNEAAAAYTTGFNAYSLYRTSQSNEAAVSADIANLTVSIVSLENAIQAALHVSPQAVLKARDKAAKIRASVSPRISISDILTELEIAAAIAQTVAGTQLYAGLAAIVINAAQQALAAQRSASGQPIDLSTIQPIALIQ
jgi:hypothetical protein